MNFGLNKVTGTGRQTVEQLKHKVIDGGGGGGGGGTVEWEDVLVSDLILHTDQETGIIFYQLPSGLIMVEAKNGGELSEFIMYFGNNPDPTASTEIEIIAGGGAESGETLGDIICISEDYVDLKKTTVSSTGEDGVGESRPQNKERVTLRNTKVWVAFEDNDDYVYTNRTTIKFYKVKE